MKKYFNPYNYFHRAWLISNRHLLPLMERLVAPDSDKPLRHPPIFILGAPRSGSTLAIQVFTDAFDFGYISNQHSRWFGAPALAEKLFHPTAGRPASNYKSDYGETKDPQAPAECAGWWYRFFRRRPPYVTLNDVDLDSMMHFRKSIATLINEFDRPVIFKNLYASLRIHAIAHYLPESLFILIHRDEVDNGHSILETRLKVFKAYEAWWSMEPPKVEELKKLPSHEQVIEQIRHIYKTINYDLKYSNVSESRLFNLKYEELCENPKYTIDSVQEFLLKNGCMIKRRYFKIPENFKRRKEVRINLSLYNSMVQYAEMS